MRVARNRSRQAMLASALSALLWATRVEAGCDPPRGRWVLLRFAATQEVSFTRGVSADASAGLAARGIDVCPEIAGEAPPFAVIDVAPSRYERVNVSVALREAASESHVSRDVELSGLPNDSRAFAVALAIDELLRPDWAEPDRSDESHAALPATSTDAPNLGVDGGAALDAAAPAPERTTRIGVGAVIERFAAGYTQWGANAGTSVSWWSRWGLDVALGIRQSWEEEATNGRVRGRAISAAGGGRYWLLREPLELGLSAGAQLQWIEFEGVATAENAIAETWSGLALYAKAGTFAAFRIAGPVWFEAVGMLGVPLRGVEATDDDQKVTGATGLQVAAAVSLSIEL
jgi:hypothetical protein